MKAWIWVLAALPLFGEDQETYLELIKKQPLGNHSKGEVEIATCPFHIEEIEECARLSLIKIGVNDPKATEWSRIGIIAEDPYLYWFRDDVIFPSGHQGTCERIIWKSGLDGHPGIAIFPISPEGKFILKLNYRHATRSWEVEIPRGMNQKEESLHAAAQRELLEKTGYQLDDLLKLGTLAPDSGILTSIIPIVACKGKNPSNNAPDDTEAILDNLLLTLEELEAGVLQGFWNVSHEGHTLRAFVRDPFLAYALLQIKLRGWQHG